MKRLQLYILIFALSAMMGCRPKGILHSWEMREIMVDLHKTDAMLQIGGYSSVTRPEERTYFYAQVLERHGTTQAQFDSSLVWYTAHPQLFDKIYPKVIAELKAEEESFLALHEVEFSEDSAPNSGVSIQKPVFTPVQLDSVLWVTQHGYPHSWNPLVHDLKDHLFPQIGVLR